MMKQIYFRFTVIVLAGCWFSAGAQPNPADSTRSRRAWLPDFAAIQFAGNIGFLSAGIGYTSARENYQLSVLYGYAPASLAGTEIQTISAKNFFPLRRFPLRNNQMVIPYLGVGLTVEVGGNAFFKQPSHYPEGYYDFPKNIHVLAYGGARMQHLFDDERKVLRGAELYAEIGSIDAWLWYKTMTNDIKLTEIFTLALGVNFLIGR